MFWVDDAPQINTTDPETFEDVEHFIDKYVSCSINDEENPDLNDVISQVQCHSKNHSATCRKNKTECRFGFPRPVSLRTFICSPISCPPEQDAIKRKVTAQTILARLWDTLNSKDLPENITTEEVFARADITQEMLEHNLRVVAKKTTIVLRRNPQSCWVNQYCSSLLVCWNANLDLQFVTDAYSCIKYILSYISKKESEEGNLLKEALRESREEHNNSTKQELKKLGNTYLTHREISIMEAIWRALSLDLKMCTRVTKWIPSGPDATR